MNKHKHSLRALGGSMVAIACVPRVPAAITIEAPKPTANADDDPGGSDPAKLKSRARGDEPGPPQVIRAEQLTASQLRLYFSEAIGPVGEIDPNDFRISVLTVYLNPNPGYSYAAYYDFGDRGYGQTLRFTGVRAGQFELDLYFEPAVPQHYCRQLQYQNNYAPPGVESDTALFLHYAAGAIPIRDAGGTALANFGADWVTAGRGDSPEGHSQVADARLRQAGWGLVRIECGPAIPEGPR